MQTYQKQCSFDRLPALQTDPTAWKRYLDRRFGGGESWVTPPFKTTDEVRQLLVAHMPELLPEFDALLPLYDDAPGLAQGLAMYNLRPFWSGCSVATAKRPDRTTLLRNYDLGVEGAPNAFRYEELANGGWIIGSGEAGWGYLDGMNDRGLVIALTFGGRFVVGDGFVVLLVIRWLLETCTTVDEALARLDNLPHRLAQNLLLLDRTGAHAVAHLSPDRPLAVDRQVGACTNHQGVPESPQNAVFTQTVERLYHMVGKGGALTLADFLCPPLYNQRYREYFGTLYTVEYDPVGGTAHFAWPERDLLVTPETAECSFAVTLTEQ